MRASAYRACSFHAVLCSGKEWDVQCLENRKCTSEPVARMGSAECAARQTTGAVWPRSLRSRCIAELQLQARWKAGLQCIFQIVYVIYQAVNMSSSWQSDVQLTR